MRIFSLFWLIVWIGVPALAQEDTQDEICTIDLSQVAALIVQAQASASSGDQSGAVATLQAIQAQIDLILVDCASDIASAPGTSTPGPPTPQDGTPGVVITTIPPTATPAPDTQLYTSPDASFSFRYPQSWELVTEGNAVFTGTTANAALVINRADAVLQPGEQSVAVVIGPPEALAPTVNFEATAAEVIAAYQTAFLNELSYEIDPAQPVTIAGYSGQQFAYRAAGYEGQLSVLALDQPQLFVLLVAAAPPGEGENLTDLVTPIAASITLGS